MKKLTHLLVILLVSATGCVNPEAPVAHLGRSLGLSNGMVISQVYGGGGNSSAVLSYDYIELFNRGSGQVNLAGWSVQYAASTSSKWQVHSLSSQVVQPGAHYLVQLATGNANVGAALPVTADSVGTINMSGTKGKVALVNSTTACGNSTSSCSSSSSAIDFMGYGSASEYEGTAASSPSDNSTALVRKGGGCTETDNNAGDFTLGTWTTALTLGLHNSGSAATPCATGDGGAAEGGITVDAAPSLDAPQVDQASLDDASGSDAADSDALKPIQDGPRADMRNTSSSSDEGCSCTVTGESPAMELVWLLVLGAVATLRWRSRRRHRGRLHRQR